LVRFWIGDGLRPFPFLTFFPAIVLTALVGGVRPAIAVTAASLLTAWYFFVPEFGSWRISAGGIIGLVFFLFVATVDIVLIELLNRAIVRGREEGARAEMLLAGREAMFKELQHRVANNMQFLSGLLAMQKRTVTGTPAEAALEQAAVRLRAMSRIHRRLYDPANAERPFGPLVEELCHELLEATGARNIVCRVDIPPIQLSPDRVHALSMIATEAMTNALKHAFPDGRAGTISIRLEQQGDDYTFIFDDDGDGPPPQLDLAASQSLGMKIMQALAQQLNGVLSFGRGARGAELRLRFRQA
jgi:two-component sensor histidine kinase